MTIDNLQQNFELTFHKTRIAFAELSSTKLAITENDKRT